jgi:hypothetical protein
MVKLSAGAWTIRLLLATFGMILKESGGLFLKVTSRKVMLSLSREMLFRVTLRKKKR